jgi:hypothetical protein
MVGSRSFFLIPGVPFRSESVQRQMMIWSVRDVSWEMTVLIIFKLLLNGYDMNE